jgi:hypothetical protein
MKKKGRPTKLNILTQEKICVAIRRGLGYEQSAMLGGIHYDTFNKWRLRAEAELTRLAQPGTRPRKQEAPFVDFYEAVQRAEIEGELTNANIIDQAAKGGYTFTEIKVTRALDAASGGMMITEEVQTTKTVPPDWRAALAILERRHPDRWLRKQKVEATGPDGGAIPITMVEVVRPVVDEPDGDGDE